MIALLVALTSVSFGHGDTPFVFGEDERKSVAEDCYSTAESIQQDLHEGKGSYNEQSQQDFLLNYFALATSLSPLHSAVPLEVG